MVALLDGLGGAAGFGEGSVARNDDGFSDRVDLSVAFPAGLSFFGAVFTGLYVNNNGSVSFGDGISQYTPSVITGNTSNPIIAPFWADVDTRGTAVTPTPGGTSRGSNLVWFDQDAAGFTATWDDVGYYDTHTDGLNAFQLRLTRVGTRDFDIDFRFEEVNWTTGDASGGQDGLGGTPARLGYSSGNGVNFLELAQSGDQAALLGLEGDGNVGQPGLFHFSVRSGAGTVFGTAGDDIVTGSAAVDVAVLGAGRRGAAVGTAGGLPVQVTSAAGHDTLSGIEVLSFVDGRLVFDAHDPAAEVTRLYNAALARGPEQAGLNYYVALVEAGRALAEIAAGFNNSPEFRSRFGAGLGDDAYIGRLYANVLGRGASEGELQFYRDQFAAGGSREQALVNFSESPENQARTAPLLQDGIWDLNENAAAVARIYDAMFTRLPDLAGLRYYREQLDGGTGSLLSIVQNFTASPEFQRLYGASPSSTEFVDLLYRNTLDRGASGEERDYYVTRIDGGALSRAQAVLNFSESPEHVAITAPDIMNNDPGLYGIAFA